MCRVNEKDMSYGNEDDGFNDGVMGRIPAGLDWALDEDRDCLLACLFAGIDYC